MNHVEPVPLVRWPDGERMLALWSIRRHAIWIEVAADGATRVNGEPVVPVAELVRRAQQAPTPAHRPLH